FEAHVHHIVLFRDTEGLHLAKILVDLIEVIDGGDLRGAYGYLKVDLKRRLSELLALIENLGGQGLGIDIQKDGNRGALGRGRRRCGNGRHSRRRHLGRGRHRGLGRGRGRHRRSARRRKRGRRRPGGGRNGGDRGRGGHRLHGLLSHINSFFDVETIGGVADPTDQDQGHQEINQVLKAPAFLFGGRLSARNGRQ